MTTRSLGNPHFLISSIDEDTCLHKPNRKNTKETFLLLLPFKSVYKGEYAAPNEWIVFLHIFALSSWNISPDTWEVLRHFFETNKFDERFGIGFPTIGKGIVMFTLRRLWFDLRGSRRTVPEVFSTVFHMGSYNVNCVGCMSENESIRIRPALSLGTSHYDLQLWSSCALKPYLLLTTAFISSLVTKKLKNLTDFSTNAKLKASVSFESCLRNADQ